jgi:predicted acetyltransferase
MSAHIRGARRADLPGIYRVLDAAFTDAPLSLFVQQTEGDSTLRYKHARVAVDGDGVSAHVRIFARRMLVRGVPVAAGGIGSVASMPDARGRGYPSALLRDADTQMRRLGMPIAFLFTGIPAFYERLGWHVVEQPAFAWDAAEAATMPHDAGYALRGVTDADVPSLLAIYRLATAGSTGAVVRTPSTWRDAQGWLDEDEPGCMVAEWNGKARAYIRCSSREYGYVVLEAECRQGHEAAITTLLHAAGGRASALRQQMVTTAPDEAALATALRTLPSTQKTLNVRYPMMMKVVDLERLVEALMPQIDEAARRHRGAAFVLGLTDEQGRQVRISIGGARATVSRKPADFVLDPRSTLMTIVGQRRVTDMLRPRPVAALGRRMDAIFPLTPLHFWMSDRI